MSITADRNPRPCMKRYGLPNSFPCRHGRIIEAWPPDSEERYNAQHREQFTRMLPRLELYQLNYPKPIMLTLDRQRTLEVDFTFC